MGSDGRGRRWDRWVGVGDMAKGAGVGVQRGCRVLGGRGKGRGRDHGNIGKGRCGVR